MQLIPGLSITEQVTVWLGNSNHPRILHVFDRACNLINERHEVLSIVSQQIGNGPFNLVVDDEISFSNALHIESAISVSDNRLSIGEFLIETTNAQLWNPCPDWDMLHRNRDHIANLIINLPVPTSQLPQFLISNLSSALVTADISPAKQFAAQVAGLGIGLTPSGDDFMIGALYAAWIVHSLEAASRLGQETVNTAATLTTSLSAAWLRSAGKGEAGILWHVFFSALASSDAVRMKSAMDEILAVGATSGADALLGFITTFTVYRELEEKHVIP